MTTKVSTLYDTVKSYLDSALSSATLIPNVYFLERQSSQFLDNGYGFTMGAASNLNNQLSCRLGMERDLAIVLTRRISATEFDDSRFATIEKQIFEDQLTVIKKFDNETGLNSSNISDVTFVGDTGLEVLTTSDQVGKFYVLTSIFRCRYIENLT